MEWESREESQNVEDRPGMGGGRKLAIGGGAGGIVILIVAALLGINPGFLQQFLGGVQQGGQQVAEEDPRDAELKHFSRVIFGDTERIWDEQFQKMGKRYIKPTLVTYSGVVESACGEAESAVGPFYCPGDSKVYIDVSFYRDMERKLNAPGDFARAYVIAHEVGHHVQRLLGYSKIVDDARRRGNDLENHHMSVRLELQADYFAGVWAHYGQEKYKFLEKGDLESALNAAFQIGDDRLQKKARGTVMPDSFTHGSSKQRMRWFKEGFDTGDVNRAKLLFSLKYNEL
jgi:uncharacterized protein